MLQQTRVETVLPYFKRWTTLFPNFSSLAKATPEAVLKEWEGLGYYTRARNLHSLARKITQTASPPKTATEWLLFPGVGPYTAAAIASIAFGEFIPTVDGNVVRILTRLTADDHLYPNGSTAAKALKPLAYTFLCEKDPGTHNQAMMELGATICLRTKPKCTRCPLSSLCAASRKKNPDAYPRFLPKKTISKTLSRLWVTHKGKLLLYQKPHGAKRLATLYELPTAELLSSPPKETPLLEKTRFISQEKITEKIYALSAATLPKRLPSLHYQWIPLDKLNTITLSGPHRRWITEIETKRRSV